jgi:hypothetical protein
MFGGSTTTSPLNVVVILQQLAYLYIFDHSRVYAAPDKS